MNGNAVKVDKPSDNGLSPSVDPLPCPQIPKKLKEGQRIKGLLYKVVPEGDSYLIAFVGFEAILLPDKPLRTKGGHVDPRAWVGHQISLSCIDEEPGVRLMPADEKQMRIWELEEALADMVGQFAFETDQNEHFSDGGLSALERAFKVLGLAEGFQGEELTRFWQYSRAIEARADAEKAVV
jgi:hypothetical protein